MIDWFNKKRQLPKISFKERLMHQSWCYANDVRVEFIVVLWNIGFIRIFDKGNIIDEPTKYKQTKLKANDLNWSNRAFEIYTEYYNKYNKHEN
jgi:hypothetical protein